MARQVYAHYMVGLTNQQELSQWKTDIQAAKDAWVDGFALNIGPDDSWTSTQLGLAYQAAAELDFKLFLSFDMASDYIWSVDSVVGLVNDFKGEAAQVLVDGKPMVSTFEGPTWADNWSSVRSQTGDIFLVPNWSSIGPSGVADKLSVIDGAFSWAAWPNAGSSEMSASEDQLYKGVLAEKPYMMGVSPYFYVNLPNWNKNWYSSSDSLWYDRWQQVLEVMPEYIEIITWNDFSESSYIGDIVDAQVVEGADVYVNGMDHSAMRAVLPYFIKAYKEGNKNVELPTAETALAWYRTTSATLGADGGTVWGQGGSESASAGTRDVVSVITITVDETEFQLSIGDTTQTFFANGTESRVNYFEMPFDGALGAVSLTMNGVTTTGPSIVDTLPATGYVNFNAAAIRL
ncbi:glycoside hydrolase [Dactylonectria estremocensis]|uniref:Glycoside hydrolase n=1 Tax=Dactylonectria estremocensis TaxID=1079267 RepID=A0A9P9FBB1_9HYPO|nr:glycoside hydrolase [Dactylonectria estremocensis]